MTARTATCPHRTADLLLDGPRLDSLVGRAVRVDRLRHKPGLSTTAALRAPDGRVLGWVQAATEDHLPKVRNAVRRAAERGRPLTVTEVPGKDGLHLVHGPVLTDPQLHRGLDRLAEVADPDLILGPGGRGVLRYNPLRRLVLRTTGPSGDPRVLRVLATPAPSPARWLQALADAGVPVVVPLRGPGTVRSGRLSAWPWVGEQDLDALTRRGGEVGAVAAEAGAALAALHGSSPHLVEAAPRYDLDLVADRLEAQLDDLAALDDGLAERLAPLVRRTLRLLAGTVTSGGAGPLLVPVHGDFSADQVAVSGSAGQVWLLDPDRLGLGPAALDLGELGATELLAGRDRSALLDPFLEGYRSAGGAAYGQDVLQAWTARSLVGRVAEPFRAGDPGWRDGVAGRLAQLEEVLA